MMKWMIDPNESRKRALCLEFGGHRLERNARTRERNGTRPVEGRNRYSAVVPRNEGQGFFLRQSNSEHRSFSASAGFHEARSERDDPGCFLKRKNSGDAVSRDFSHAMTDDGRRLNAPGFPKRRERHLHGKNGRLSNLRPLHLGCFFRAAEFFEKREAGPRTERGVTIFNRLAKHRLMLHQLATHSPPLRTLSAQDEANTWRLFPARCESRPDLLAFFFLRKGVEFRGQFRPTVSHKSKPVRVMITSDSQGIGEIRQNGRATVGIGMLLNPRAQIGRRSPERCFRTSGKHHWPGT